MVFWEGYMSDESMGIFAPIVVYWLYAGFYQALPPLEKYRLHSKNEEDEKNLVSLASVVKGVLLQQIVQAVVAYLLFLATPNNSAQEETQSSVLEQMVRFCVAMVVLDAWQYFVHRFVMHHNKFMYRYVHSQHHRLIVPYAIGALYSHPLEGLLDTISGAIAFLVSGMNARTSVYFFCFSMMKTIDDHCGLWLPANIFHLFFENNSAYHDIHHQIHGFKYNYASMFFPFWDKLLGTHMPYSLVKRPRGGFEAKPLLKKH
ncbi:very-long-chain aldehyde decarbonylase GL1-9-like [Impatiens glandulifera]|uniref:very-long-chain aldehyde decarbonylase GL1-9-like n=1 Tax=Impatiens glandulifera TaxID=253017 RepID=UPI001FB090AC|nr:very-long-chain aldehyde decarbonylase GL1-9-like [Impatiens glandulifera]